MIRHPSSPHFYAEVDLRFFTCFLSSRLCFSFWWCEKPFLHYIRHSAEKRFQSVGVVRRLITNHSEQQSSLFFSSSFGNVGNALQPARKSVVVLVSTGNRTQRNCRRVEYTKKRKKKSESQFFIQLHSRSSTHQRRAEAGYREVKKCVTICLMSMRLKIELGHWVVVESMENDWSTSKQPEAETRRGFSPHSVVWCRDLGLSRRLFKSDMYRGREREWLKMGEMGRLTGFDGSSSSPGQSWTTVESRQRSRTSFWVLHTNHQNRRKIYNELFIYSTRKMS